MKHFVLLILLGGIFPVLNSCSDSIRSDNHDELQRLYQELRDIKVEISKLQQQMVSYGAPISSLEAQLVYNEISYQQWNNEFNDIQFWVSIYESKLPNLKKEEAEILEEISNLEAIIEDTLYILEDMEDSELYDHFSQLLQERYEKLATLEDQLKEKQQEIAEMEASLEELKEQLNQYMSEQASREEEYQKEKSRLEAEIKNWDDAKAELRKKLSELLARKAEIEEMIKRLTGS